MSLFIFRYLTFSSHSIKTELICPLGSSENCQKPDDSKMVTPPPQFLLTLPHEQKHSRGFGGFNATGTVLTQTKLSQRQCWAELSWETVLIYPSLWGLLAPEKMKGRTGERRGWEKAEERKSQQETDQLTFCPLSHFHFLTGWIAKTAFNLWASNFCQLNSSFVAKSQWAGKIPWWNPAGVLLGVIL